MLTFLIFRYSLQVYTQHAYMRPYGVSTMLQLGVKLFPAGDLLRILAMEAWTIGSCSSMIYTLKKW